MLYLKVDLKDEPTGYLYLLSVRDWSYYQGLLGRGFTSVTTEILLIGDRVSGHNPKCQLEFSLKLYFSFKWLWFLLTNRFYRPYKIGGVGGNDLLSLQVWVKLAHQKGVCEDSPPVRDLLRLWFNTLVYLQIFRAYKSFAY